MYSAHLKKLNDLIASANSVLTSHPEWPSTVRDERAAQHWIISAVTAVEALCPETSSYVREIKQIGANRETRQNTPFDSIFKMQGILQAVSDDAAAGILRSPEDIAFATAFDDFLDHAVEFYRLKKYGEAAVLGSVVLEDAIKRIAKKHTVPHSGQTLDPIIDLLVKASVLTPIKAKRLKAYAGVRNEALHANWENIDPKDVDEMLRGVRELLDTHLA